MQEQPGTIRIFHTSDWHLGRTLHEMPRDDEFDAFLQWLLAEIEREKIDVLLIAGDIFDTSNPTHAAQQRYYRFCTNLSRTCCRHAVITSGNHDSTSFIDVPSELLYCLNVHVIGQPRFGIGKAGTPADEVVVLKDSHGNDELIVAAVPFLSDGDVRTSLAGEDTETKQQKMRAGVAEHYRLVAEECERIRAGRDIPVVAMGHLFVSGGKLGDGVRPTFVGNLGGVEDNTFGSTFDYVALGHLHVPQSVGNRDHIRYSGAPLVMGFGEAGQQKSLCEIEFTGRKPSISLYPVPQFRKIVDIKGNRNDINCALEKLVQDAENAYISVTYSGNEAIDSVMAMVSEMLDELYQRYRPGLEGNVFCINTQMICHIAQDQTLEPTRIKEETLDDFDELEVFQRLLDSQNVPEEDRASLIDTYQELLRAVQK